MKRILLISDASVFRDLLGSVLQKSGHEIATAANLGETSTVLASGETDLIVINTATLDGASLAILESVRRRPANVHTPVMILAATNDRPSIVAAARLGVRDYLIRPQLRLEGLLSRIQLRLAPPGAQGPIPSRGSAMEAAAPSGVATSKATQSHPPAHLRPAPAQGERPRAPNHPSRSAQAPLPDLKPLTPAEVEARLQDCGELKALSPVASQVLKLTGSSECSLGRISAAIKRDQALSLKILRLANSPIYTRGEPVESVQKAVMRIGLQQIRQTVLNLAVVDQFNADDPEGEIQSGSFWEHSIACGLLAAELTRCAAGSDADIDAAFTVGLLHDVGRMVLAQQLGPHYSAVTRAARASGTPLERAETQALGVNHADIMERILVAWRFPRHLIHPIVFHHLSMGNIRQLAPSEIRPIAVLALANRLTHALLIGDSGNPTIYPTHELARGLKISAQVIREVEERIPGQANEIKASMLASSNERHWAGIREGVVRQMPKPFRPLFIGKDAGIDAFRLLCDALAEPGNPGPPTIAVVHLTHEREQASLGQQLRETEARHGGHALPTILISPKGECHLEERDGAGRRLAPLASPLSLRRFVEAVQSLMAVTDAQTTAKVV